MELIEATVTAFQKRARSLAVDHSQTRLTRGLEYGERVLVLCDGEYRTAVVNHIDFSAEDTHYQLVLGGRVPPETARARLRGEPATPSGRWSVHDVAEALAAPRPRRVPLQRSRARVLRTD